MSSAAPLTVPVSKCEAVTEALVAARLGEKIGGWKCALPGDVILTGTPAGVGQGFNPPVYLQPGDEIVVGSSILGEQRNTVTDYDPARAGELLARMAAA